MMALSSFSVRGDPADRVSSGAISPMSMVVDSEEDEEARSREGLSVKEAPSMTVPGVALVVPPREEDDGAWGPLVSGTTYIS